MGRAPPKNRLDRDGRGRAEHDLADRRRLVVDVADPRAQPGVVEGVGADEADLLLGREQELEPAVRAPLLDHAPRRLEHDRDG